MSHHLSRPTTDRHVATGLALLVLTAACTEPRLPGEPHATRVATPGVRADRLTARGLASFDCVARPALGRVVCSQQAAALAPGVSADVIPVQGSALRLTWTNPRFDGTTFTLDVSVRNLMREAIGTPDGARADTNGIRVFVTGTTGVGTSRDLIAIDNPDGMGNVAGAEQPYFRYDELLRRNATTATKPWRFVVPPDVSAFGFQVLVSTEVQPLLVINEVLANPGGSVAAADGEWFELYNAGTRDVLLTGLLLADSSRAGRRAFHAVTDTVVVPAGGYAVLGGSRDRDANGGVHVDYAYGGALAFGTGPGALTLARAYGGDTLTIDRVAFNDPAVDASRGVARELRNPALGNDDLDGANWADAATGAVFGPAGRGTPGAQNSTFTPIGAPGRTPRVPVGVPVARRP